MSIWTMIINLILKIAVPGPHISFATSEPYIRCYQIGDNKYICYGHWK